MAKKFACQTKSVAKYDVSKDRPKSHYAYHNLKFNAFTKLNRKSKSILSGHSGGQIVGENINMFNILSQPETPYHFKSISVVVSEIFVKQFGNFIFPNEVLQIINFYSEKVRPLGIQNNFISSQYL